MIIISRHHQTPSIVEESNQRYQLHQSQQQQTIFASAVHRHFIFIPTLTKSVHFPSSFDTILIFQKQRNKQQIMIKAIILVTLSTTTAFLSPHHSPIPKARPHQQSQLQAKKKIFIDGEAGTTGLQVRDRLANREDLEIVSISDELRKDSGERKRLINEADCVILCEFW